MQDFIVQTNIVRFKALIAQELDFDKRHVLLELLEEETAKLCCDEIAPIKESLFRLDQVTPEICSQISDPKTSPTGATSQCEARR